MDYGYRSSVLKRNPERVAILSATFQMVSDTKEDIDNRMADFMERRRRTQPPGASMGSMFKNPPGDYAGRLIESAGLKGHRLGGAQISPLHGNFFLNQGTATADDIWQLVMMTRKRIHEKFGVDLELEIERLGDWPEE
jgi:UDP-N-acetylmuramate dehydrogenase